MNSYKTQKITRYTPARLCASLVFSLVFLAACTKQEPQGPISNTFGISDAQLVNRLNTSVVGESPDGEGNPEGVCNEGKMQAMSSNPECGYVDIGQYCLQQINAYRAKHRLPPYVRAPSFDACASKEARLALEAGRSHWNAGCQWRGQAGGGGGQNLRESVEKTVFNLVRNIYNEGPNGGHYKGMMRDVSRCVACGYYASGPDRHKIFIDYYNVLK